jgi:Mrp family chromosome partitioning ATPase/capsular polysaccharide biosynthesis protein
MLQYGQVLGQEDTADEPRRHLYVIASLLRRWKTIAFSVAAALTLAALVLALKPANYTASTQLLIYNRELYPGPDAVISPGRADTALVENMIEIFKSRSVLAKVIETLKLNEDAEASFGRSPWHVVRDWMMPSSLEEISEQERIFENSIERFRQALSVKRVGTSHTVLVTYTSSDPHKAAAVANEIAVSAARVFRGTESGSSGISPLRERLQGLGPSAYVISEADPPVRPDGPRRASLVAIFLLAGLGLGAALALLRDFRDRTIRTAGQVERMLGLECFGTVEHISERAARGSTEGDSKACTVEARTVQDVLKFGGSDQWPPSLAQALHRALTVTDSILAMQTVGVTSTVPGEGTTTLAAGLARIAVDSGKKVLLVDVAKCGHIATPAASGEFPAPTNMTEGDEIQVGTPEANSSFNSDTLKNPRLVALNSADRLNEVLREVAPGYDMVVVDLPPLSGDPVALAAARKLDGMLLVLKWGTHDADAVRRALELSSIAPTSLAGVILNLAPGRLIGRYGDRLAGVQARLARWPSVPRAPKEGNRTEEDGELAPV